MLLVFLEDLEEVSYRTFLEMGEGLGHDRDEDWLLGHPSDVDEELQSGPSLGTRGPTLHQEPALVSVPRLKELLEVLGGLDVYRCCGHTVHS